jgi:hypothetical protein
MKRIFASLLLVAFSTAAFAQAPESRWRSPFTSAPALGGVSPLDAERNRKAMEQDQATWAARRQAAPVAHTERAPFLTSPKQLGRVASTSGR